MKKGITLKEFAKLQLLTDEDYLDDFTKMLLEKQPDRAYKTKSIKYLPLHLFVDLERFLEDSDFISFCSIFVKGFWIKNIYFHNLAPILAEYGRQKAELFEIYPYIFNPPQYGEPVKETQGIELRREFVQEFGSYVVLMDVVCKGDLTRYKTVEKWKTEEFLFWANYLSGQKIVESVK